MLKRDGCFVSGSFAYSERDRDGDDNGAGDLEFEIHSRGSLNGPRSVLGLWMMRKVERAGQCRS